MDKIALQVLLMCICMIHIAASLTCHDQKGKEVDWYTIYKVPEIRKSKEQLIQNGAGFFYLDVHTPKWSLSKISIKDKNQAVAFTLSQIYQAKNESILHIMYNDESPKSDFKLTEEYYPNGHTKGVVAFDGESGFWLIHSVPKFPPQKSKDFEYPHNGLKYGQSMLCISFSYKELGSIAKQLRYNQPGIYDIYLPPKMKQDFPDLKNIKEEVQGPPWSSVVYLSSKGGQPFTSFAKSVKFNKDLYADLIAPTLRSYLLVETWMSGEGQKLVSNCSIEYKVFDITKIQLPSNVSFKETHDHSKWATTFVAPHEFDSSKTIVMKQLDRWTCIGDINRKITQMHKGGGSVCINHEQVWNSYQSVIQDYMECKLENVHL